MIKALISLLVVSTATVAYCVATQTYVTFNVTNYDREPVEGAKIEVFFIEGGVSDRDEDLTDGDGVASLAGAGRLGLDFRITKEGYYKSIGGKASENQSIDIVLREVRNPIPMYAKLIDFYVAQYVGKEVQYDFIEGDYLPPYGSGVTGDIKIIWQHESSGVFNVDSVMTIEFLNENDGMVKFSIPPEKWYSDFKSDYEVVTSGFVRVWSFYNRRGGVGTPSINNFDHGANYYIRLRTQVDEHGEVISARYGKMYGEVNANSEGIPYYINPTPNDLNIEFDWRQNLFTDLPQEERVFAP